LEDVLFYILWVIAKVFQLDERPEARKITIGCAVIALGLFGLIWLYFAL
jgi:hypothetical protein